MRNRSWLPRRVAVLSLALLSVGVLTVQAQQPVAHVAARRGTFTTGGQGLIAGVVDDAARHGLPRVVVRAFGLSGIGHPLVPPSTATTDSHGRYRLALPAGVYRVQFSLTGFQTVVREHISLEAASRVPLDARLSQVELHEGVLVTGLHLDAAPSSAFDRRPPVRHAHREPVTGRVRGATTPRTAFPRLRHTCPPPGAVSVRSISP